MASSSRRGADSGRNAQAGSSGLNCVIAKGTKIDGQFRSAESVRMDGTLIGDVDCDKKLVLGEMGTIEGNVTCADAVIMGHVKGGVSATNTLFVGKKAIIEGHIIAQTMNIEEGARCHGECKIG